MNIALNCLSLFSIGMGLYQIIAAVYVLRIERRHLHRLLAPREKMPPWYTNARLREQSTQLISGVFLVMVGVGLFALSNHATVFGAFCISLTAFLCSCSNGLWIFFREAGQRVAEQKQGEKHYYWLHQPRLYQGVAISLFCLSLSIAALLWGLVFAKITTFDITDQLAWAWETPMLVGTLTWVIAWLLLIARRQRGGK